MSKTVSNIYKYRLLKDLPEYPKGCVFVLNEKGWRGYWDGGDWKIPEWLEQLLYRNVPEPHDEMVDWLEPVVDEVTTFYEVTIAGGIIERTIYDFWIQPTRLNVFRDRDTAEKKAEQVKRVFES